MNIGAEQPTITHVELHAGGKAVLGKYERVQYLNVCFCPLFGNNVIRPAVWQTAVMCKQ